MKNELTPERIEEIRKMRAVYIKQYSKLPEPARSHWMDRLLQEEYAMGLHGHAKGITDNAAAKVHMNDDFDLPKAKSNRAKMAVLAVGAASIGGAAVYFTGNPLLATAPAVGFYWAIGEIRKKNASIKEFKQNRRSELRL